MQGISPSPPLLSVLSLARHGGRDGPCELSHEGRAPFIFDHADTAGTPRSTSSATAADTRAPLASLKTVATFVRSPSSRCPVSTLSLLRHLGSILPVVGHWLVIDVCKSMDGNDHLGTEVLLLSGIDPSVLAACSSWNEAMRTLEFEIYSLYQMFQLRRAQTVPPRQHLRVLEFTASYSKADSSDEEMEEDDSPEGLPWGMDADCFHNDKNDIRDEQIFDGTPSENW